MKYVEFYLFKAYVACISTLLSSRSYLLWLLDFLCFDREFRIHGTIVLFVLLSNLCSQVLRCISLREHNKPKIIKMLALKHNFRGCKASLRLGVTFCCAWFIYLLSCIMIFIADAFNLLFLKF